MGAASRTLVGRPGFPGSRATRAGNTWRAWRLGLLALLAVLLTGCATQTRSLLSQPDPSLPSVVELKGTPFFAQEDYQCGPAALAMVLQSAAIKVTPEALVPQVYVPARQGSLQPEMLAAARRNGALAVTLPPQLRALLDEVAAGNPVVVLQNLSLPIKPLWHYAVVIGYDLAAEEIILRSGTTEREVMPLSTFENTWRRSGFWSMVAMPPGRLPRTATEADVTEALVAFEKSAAPADAWAAYKAALQRWPGNLTIELGTGNSAWRAGNKQAALATFRKAATDHPDSVAALNNLASALAELGQLDEALPIAQRAVALGGPLNSIATATLAEIQIKRGASR